MPINAERRYTIRLRKSNFAHITNLMETTGLGPSELVNNILDEYFKKVHNSR